MDDQRRIAELEAENARLRSLLAEQARTDRIPLRGLDLSVRAYAMVDGADYEMLAASRWCLVAGNYAGRHMRGSNRRIIYMHREILGLGPEDDEVADHINHNRLDNRRANLRAVSHAMNAQNQLKRPDVTSRYRNVSWDLGTEKWMVRFCLAGRRHYLGLFDDEHEAGRVASEWRAINMPAATA